MGETRRDGHRETGPSQQAPTNPNGTAPSRRLYTQWSTALGGTVSVSISGTLTGFTAQGGSPVTVAYSSIPISGTATAVIAAQ